MSISTFQILSEDFIREFKDKVIWSKISAYQKLSEEFIRKFKDKVDWENIIAWQNNLTEDFIKEFRYKLNKNCWVYLEQRLSNHELVNFSKEFKQEVMERSI